MSRDIFLPRPESEKLSRIQPLMNLRLIERLRAGIFSTRRWVRHGPILRLRKHAVGDLANHGSIRGSWPIAFSGYPRGHSVIREPWWQTTGSNSLLDTHPRT